MTKSAKITGIIMIIVGFILILVPFLFSFGEAWFVSWIYGIPLFLIGLFVLLNKNEDKIEEINYGGKK